MPDRYDGLTFIELKQAVFTVTQQAFPTTTVNKTQIEQWVRTANSYVDARLQYSVGLFETITVEGQANYDLYDAPSPSRPSPATASPST